MRKTTLLLASLAAMLLASGVALAATVRCEGGECRGTRKDDEMRGTSRREIMYAFRGNDELYGKAGEDDLYGFDGNDLAKGGDGKDNLYGDWGADHLYGMEGSDFLDGGASHDALYGGEGDDELVDSTDFYSPDQLNGGGGDDLLNGGQDEDRYVFGPGWGHDTISDSDSNPEPWYEVYYGDRLEFSSVATGLTVNLNTGDGDEVSDGANSVEWTEPYEFYGVIGGKGNDTITGDDTMNVIEGGEGADTVSGGDAADRLYGGDGDDELFANGGGPYSDELTGGKGDDLLDGGDGSTSFYFGPGWGNDTVTGNPELRPYLSFYYIPPESVWRRNETVVYVRSDLTIDLTPGDGPEVTDGTNTIDWNETVDVYRASGGSGDDKITGNSRDNSLGGSDGADRIDAHGGDDYVYGGTGGDTIRSGDGDDRVYAFDRQSDSGVDRVNCGAGDRDVVYIQEANANNTVNCEDVRFRVGGGGY